MDLEIILSEISQAEKDKYFMISLTLESKKIKSIYLPNRNRLSDRKQTYDYPVGKRKGKDKLGVWD